MRSPAERRATAETSCRSSASSMARASGTPTQPVAPARVTRIIRRSYGGTRGREAAARVTPRIGSHAELEAVLAGRGRVVLADLPGGAAARTRVRIRAAARLHAV